MNRKNLYILSAVLMVVMLGFGMVMPIFPFYIESMGASGTELGLLLAISPFIQLIFAPIWGAVSDRRGRKPVLAIGILGYALSLLFYGLATELWMLFVARALGGILSAATMPTTYAYISDSTTEEERGGGIGMLGAAAGLGMIFGPVLGGWLAVESLSTPFFITAALAMSTLPMVFFFMPESLPPEQRQKGSPAGFGGLDLRGMAAAARPISFLLFLAFLVSFALTNFQGIFGLYALRKFGYGTTEVGWIMTVMGAEVIIAQGILAGPLTKRWGDGLVIKATLLVGSIGFLVLLWADDFFTVLLTTALFTLPNALLRPAVIALTSKQLPEQQGTVMGVSNACNSLGRVIGPIWAGFVFDINISLPYVSGAMIMLVAFLASTRWVVELDDQPQDKGLLPRSLGN